MPVSQLLCGEVFGEEFCVKELMSTSSTTFLDQTLLSCVYQFLKAKTFNKHQIQIYKWIFQEILASKNTISNEIVQVIDEYIAWYFLRKM